jgi:hypothetical protein
VEIVTAKYFAVMSIAAMTGLRVEGGGALGAMCRLSHEVVRVVGGGAVAVAPWASVPKTTSGVTAVARS